MTSAAAKVGVVLDAGAFIALERQNATMVALVRRFVSAATPLVTSAGMVAERQRGWPVLTSDLADLRAIDRTLDLHKI